MTRFCADVIVESDQWTELDLQSLADRVGVQVVDHLDLTGEFECAILACDDARIAVLNADFRGKPRPTNVLSWPSSDLVPPEVPTDPELGDVALAFETCRTEADQGNLTLGDHVTHLIVHGLLHLLGYDHITDAQAEVMEGLEVVILSKLNVADPYGRMEINE